MIDKKKLPEFIERYNNKQLHGKDLEEFLEMLKNDPGLRLEVKLDKDLNEILAEPDVIEFRRKLIKNRIPEEKDGPGLSLYLFAASVALIISLAVLAFIWIRKSGHASLKTEYQFNLPDTNNIFKNQMENDDQAFNENTKTDKIIGRDNEDVFSREDDI